MKKILSDKLMELSYSYLKTYAGVNNNSKTKEELVEIIMRHFTEQMNILHQKKLDNLNKQLN